MDEIAQQLRSETQSLEDHIERAGDRLLAAHWADALIEPFEQIESTLEGDDLRAAIVAFHHARNRFKINGHVADRIDEILERHSHLVADLDEPVDKVAAAEYEDVVLPPDADPGDTVTDDADSLFLEEDEEPIDAGVSPTSDTPHLPAYEDGAVVFNPSGDEEEGQTVDFGSDMPANELHVDFGRDTPADDDSGPLAGTPTGTARPVEDKSRHGSLEGPSDGGDSDDLFGAGTPTGTQQPVEDKTRNGSLEGPSDGAGGDDLFSAGTPTGTQQPVEDKTRNGSLEGPSDGAGGDDLFSAGTPTGTEQPVEDKSRSGSLEVPPDGGGDDLFSAGTPTGTEQPVEDKTRDASLERPSDAGDDPFGAGTPTGTEHSVEDKTRDASLGPPAGSAAPTLYSIFAHAISVDDAAAGLDITVSAADRSFLEQKLRARLSDPVVAALRAQKSAEKQYILIPRLTRGTDPASGGTLPMTVKNMATRYTGLFGDIRDLMRYRNDSMMSTEVPEPGWALITTESPRESLSKNYMQQNQYLRFLTGSLAIPSHLIRRRTMVEAIYDLVVGELVLGQHLQRASLDWTSSSPAKNDFVCVYFPDEGIRVRDLSRVTRHQSLGVTPNW
ncbi:MAG TPA: hypothetical protein QGF95_09465 [Candidatus Latescibacteria bacterium]|nr:hypothetical protein [Candidatus Latescibacterota bacterium]